MKWDNNVEGKYNIIKLNAILFDRRSPFEKQIPPSVKYHKMWYYVWRILFAIIKESIRVLLKYPIHLWFSGYGKYEHIYDNNIIFFVESTNNYRALKKVIDGVVEKRTNVVVLDRKKTFNSFPRLIILFRSFLNVFSLYNEIKKLTPSDRRIAGYYITNLFLSFGYTYCCRKILSRYRPESIIMANDHSYNKKAMVLICEDLNIKTIYVQHASVSYAFPELHFSYSFLDGIDSFDKYTDGGKIIYGRTILLGAARYDSLSSYRVKRKHYNRNCIGISVNKLDDSHAVLIFCLKLLEKFPKVNLRIRTHPSIRNFPLSFEINKRVCCISANNESILDFMNSIDVQISGDSAVHFDAILAGVPSLAYNFTSLPYGDNYKYVENGLIELADNIETVFTFIKSKEIRSYNTSLISQYDESYGKSYAGHCSEIVSDFINNGYDFGKFTEKYNLGKNVYKDEEYFYIS